MSHRSKFDQARVLFGYGICRLLQEPRILGYKLVSNCKQVGRPRLHQPLQAQGLGKLTFERDVQIGVFPSPYFFSSYAYIEARNPQARVTFGEGCRINNNFCAIAEHTSIAIGRRVLIGTGVEIFDSDFHGLRIVDRARTNPIWAQPVVIEDDVFLGSNVRVLKGVTVGRGSVIANGALVVTDVPPGVISGGVPSRVIKVIS